MLEDTFDGLLEYAVSPVPSFEVSCCQINTVLNNQDIIYDYQAEIHGTGNRSEVVL